MFEISTILAPLSSTGDAPVLQFADYVSSLYQARLHSAHVVPQMSAVYRQVLFPYAALGEDVTEFERELIEHAQTGLRERLSTATSSHNGTPHPHSVLYGNVLDRLLLTIERIGPDLVVVGANTGREHAHQLGSTASALLRSWAGAILLVRQQDGTDSAFSHVVVATDLGPGSPEVLTAACGLAVRSQSRVTAVAVLDDPRRGDAAGLLRGAVRVDGKALHSKGKRNASQQFKRHMESLGVPFSDLETLKQVDVSLDVRVGDPVEEVRDLVGQLDNPLLVVGRSQAREVARSPLGRTAEALLRRVPTHVLVVPTNAPDQDRT